MKKLKPNENSQRNTNLIDYSKLLSSSVKKYPRNLFLHLPNNAGRNNQGRITTRHQGSGHKKTYRLIDFKRYPHDNIPGTIKSIEYNPYGTGFISLVNYQNGSKAFILAYSGIKIGDKILSGDKEDIPVNHGNNLPLKYIPAGTFIHNVELKPGKGGQLVRSAGSSAQVMGKDETGRYILVRLASKEIRKILAPCRATIGQVSNEENKNVKLGKAGRNRWRGKRPTVRASAMNPVDHPYGGGEGKTGLGRPDITRGKRTRKKKKLSNKYIVRSRHLAKK